MAIAKEKRVELIVKVDPTRAADPVAHVRGLIAPARPPAPDAEVEEVFPGLRTGRSAGLVSVRLACAPGSKSHRDSLAALRADDAVSYVEEPRPRRAL
jgi:hypothetical protein